MYFFFKKKYMRFRLLFDTKEALKVYILYEVITVIFYISITQLRIVAKNTGPDQGLPSSRKDGFSPGKGAVILLSLAFTGY